MRKILVPVDFSGASKVALDFAKFYAQKVEGTIKVIHVWYPDIHVETPGGMQPPGTSLETESIIFSKFLKDNDIPKEDGILEIGLPSDVLISLSKLDDFNLIIMGTTGANTALDKIFGSVSSKVAIDAHCPVLLIPKNVYFSGTFSHILYGSAEAATEEDMLEDMITFAKAFDAKVHFVHVNTDGDEEEAQEVEDEIFDEIFENQQPEIKFNIVTLRDTSVVDGLNQYAEENEIDLCVMVTRHRKWWEKLLHRSQTQLLALNTKLPLLIFHND